MSRVVAIGEVPGVILSSLEANNTQATGMVTCWLRLAAGVPGADASEPEANLDKLELNPLRRRSSGSASQCLGSARGSKAHGLKCHGPLQDARKADLPSVQFLG
ncbi:unnamed protein product [Effrenium voratum]|nr:unnamed protein product [Effrenium voratum]